MTDGVANNSVDARATGELIGAIKRFHFIERELARGRGILDGGIRKGAAVAEREDARWQSNFAHGNGNDLPATACKAQQRESLAERTALRGNFDRARV